MAEAGAERSDRGGRRGKRRVLTWALGAGSAVAGGLWVLGPRSYTIDVLVSYQVWLVAGCVLAAGLCALLRRWGAGAVCALAAIAGGWPLIAGRSVWVPPVDLGTPPGPGVVRVVSFNAGPESTAWEADLGRVLGWHADAVVLIEVPVELNRGVRRRGLLDGSGWGWAHRAWVDGVTSPCFVLSRWPMERVGVPGVGHAERDILTVRLETGAGPVLVGLAHPHSPRTRERWAMGNETAARTLPGMAGAAASMGLPLAVGADLNAGPAGSRAGSARAAGLSMSKPLAGGWWGSYPSGWAGPARVQLDDVWVSSGFEVVAWSSVASEGSDHRIIVADLRPVSGDGPAGQPGR